MGLGEAVVRWWRRWSAARPVAPSADAAVSTAIARFGRFVLERRVGRGAFSEVFYALDSAQRRHCALKVWAPAASESAGDRTLAMQRFIGEARLRRHLDHPDIVRLLDAGQTDGRPWMALEWVEGCELARYSEAARLLPPARVAALGARIADALHHAHRQGLVHRDLKPANVLVDLARDTVKLTDFGVSREDGGEPTRTGVLLGSPAYLAPEQLAGGTPDVRGDIYALGALLFELLTGRLPFEAPTLGELLRQVAQAPVPDVRSLRPDIPPELAQIVQKALAKDPAARPVDGAEIARELRRCATSGTPRPPGPP